MLRLIKITVFLMAGCIICAANAQVQNPNFNLEYASYNLTSLASSLQTNASEIEHFSESNNDYYPISENTLKQRELFKQTMDAYAARELDLFAKLSAQNKDYILYPYIQYYDLLQNLSSASEEAIFQFIKETQGFPLSGRMRTKWLYVLADQENWPLFLKVYKPQGSIKLQCAHVTARLKQIKGRVNLSKKKYKHFYHEIRKLWLSGEQHPEQCNYAFELFEKFATSDVKLVWQKIELLMQQGNSHLVSELTQGFGSRDKKIVELWINVHKHPEKYLKSKRLRKNTLMNRKIVVHGINRFAKKDARGAMQLWDTLKKRYRFSAEIKGEVYRDIALRSAYQSDDNAYNWLANVPRKYADTKVRHWRAMIALRAQKWQALIKSLQSMPDTQRNESNWLYWAGRAHEELGNSEISRKYYLKLAKETNYYGFLAADKLNIDYAINIEPLHRDEKIIREIAQLESIKRSYELYKLGRMEDARSEWNYSIYRFKAPKLKQAAILAHRWGWHNNAIITVAKTPHRRDLDLRFPTPFLETVFENADELDMDPSYIYGIARRESAFNENARSSKGALGLMQLMPGTARLVAKKLGMARPSQEDILQFETNIRFGSAYLNFMLERFNGHPVLATAAYNAGPRRVDRWIPKTNSMVADLWVESVPYKETRDYIKAVLAYSIIFDSKIKKSITPLKNKMRDIRSVSDQSVLK